METLETDVGLIDCGQASRKTHGLPFSGNGAEQLRTVQHLLVLSVIA